MNTSIYTDELFFSNWRDIWHAALCTAIAFFSLFAFIRITGKRTLANLNAFDFLVTIALGSTLSAMMLSAVPLATGATSLVLIIAFQYLLAYIAKLSPKMDSLVNSKPTILFYKGEFVKQNMKREVVTEHEIYSEIRERGIYDINEVFAVVMELNGHITTIKKPDALSDNNSLDNLSKPD